MIYLHKKVLEGRQSPETVRFSDTDHALVTYIFSFPRFNLLLWSRSSLSGLLRIVCTTSPIFRSTAWLLGRFVRPGVLDRLASSAS